MKTTTFSLPMMYADHHVTEVRRLLGEITGVDEVYASSAFLSAEVTFDEAKVSEDEISAKLEEAGYLGEVPVAVEKEASGEDYPFFRKSAVIEQARSSVSFGQNVAYQGRPLWPCPGMGQLTRGEDGS